ncbi:MAG: tetratricopeptide repeat protein [Candidatus Heimdallarchaeota archaeon]|nr:tetratricopeptide repeat protein [Candidatus Heimdallarchaeota archaeon]
MGLPTDLGQLINEIASSDFQLTEELSQRVSEMSALLQDNPETLIELNMIVGVQLGSREGYAYADEYFMACWPHAHRLNREEGMYAWPWGEEEKVNPVDTLERIDLYQFIQPFYEVIEPKEYFAFLEFQLRCQEVVGMIRKGEYATANLRLLGLFDHIPRSVHVKNDVLSELRKEFREQRKLDLQVQAFDLGTFYHYLGISYWLTSDLENARVNFEESLWFREKGGHYLDKRDNYGNLGTIHRNKGVLEKALHYYQSTLELLYEFGDPIEIVDILYQLAQIKRRMGELTEALHFLIEANNECKKYGNRSQQAESYLLLGEGYKYLYKFDEAKDAYSKGLELGGDINLLSKLYFFEILILIKIGDINRAELQLQKFKSEIIKSKDNNIKTKYLICKLNLKLKKQEKIPKNDLDFLINTLSDQSIPIEIKAHGLIILMIYDLIYGMSEVKKIKNMDDWINSEEFIYFFYSYIDSKKILSIEKKITIEIDNSDFILDIIDAIDNESKDSEVSQFNKDLVIKILEEYLVTKVYKIVEK